MLPIMKGNLKDILGKDREDGGDSDEELE